MKPSILHFFAAILLIYLMIFYPEMLINPGHLLEGHQEIRQDCLACHTPFQGASTGKCTSCHKLDQIGLMTVGGEPIPKDKKRILFHQNLSDRQCTNCHTDHVGLEFQSASMKFSHNLLAESIQTKCTSCHENQKPGDSLHRSVVENCANCHRIEGWRIISFDHQYIRVDFQQVCESCHQKNLPGDDLHRQVKSECFRCHKIQGWKPSTFDHAQFFRFDRNHPADCKTCHTQTGRLSEHTCYGCHEHSRAKMAEEHRKEGIINFENCVECHRSGDKGEAKRMRRELKSSKRRERHHGKDD